MMKLAHLPVFGSTGTLAEAPGLLQYSKLPSASIFNRKKRERVAVSGQLGGRREIGCFFRRS
jgi:hypothetical protein